jgi:hypothetical protein
VRLATTGVSACDHARVPDLMALRDTAVTLRCQAVAHADAAVRFAMRDILLARAVSLVFPGLRCAHAGASRRVRNPGAASTKQPGQHACSP